MKKLFLISGMLCSVSLMSQDNSKDTAKGKAEAKTPVKIFNSEKTINANTTEVVAKGKMDFKVTHNFNDIAGHDGGIKNFFGLDNSTDIRIGFHIGLTDRLNLIIARTKGDGMRLRPDTLNYPGGAEYLAGKLYEVALKYQLLRQMENDPTNPVSIALLVNAAISSQKSAIPFDTNAPASFTDFGDRMSQLVQLIIAKRIGQVSIQINPTLVHYNYVPTYDRATTFALGGALRVPVTKSFAILVDYFHSFIQDQKEKNYYNSKLVKFHDPLGVGFELITAGHNFHLNFTNTTAILENQVLPYNSNSWGKGQFRWGFNISRTFVLWRSKTYTENW